MTLYDYKRSLDLSGQPFYALVMAAFREADSFNFERLQNAFPGLYAELQERYDAPGGLLVGERDADTGMRRMPEGLVDDAGTLIRPC